MDENLVKISKDIDAHNDADKPRRLAVYSTYKDLYNGLIDEGIPEAVVSKFIGWVDVKINAESYGTDTYYAILNRSIATIKEAYDELSFCEQLFVDRMKSLVFIVINPPKESNDKQN